MLDFRYSRRGINGADALRKYRQRTGMAGHHRIWSQRETDTLKRLYPDYKKAMRALPGRTYYAIRGHAAECGIVHRRHVWTGAEISRLRKLAAAGASDKELMVCFSGLRKNQIAGALKHYRIKRRRRKFKSIGHILLDALRERCYELGLTMVDLDDIAKTRRYFAYQDWWGSPVRLDKVVKAILALDGNLTVEWK